MPTAGFAAITHIASKAATTAKAAAHIAIIQAIFEVEGSAAVVTCNGVAIALG